MLKLRANVGLIDVEVRSQTFPEGKGVETPGLPVLVVHSVVSQTFPEGKGVETRLAEANPGSFY